ncbi:MAG: hypothetical protein J6K77_00155 [Ruminococcus sp.]|nr:hypothetical protein [Ruminococcus sp.]
MKITFKIMSILLIIVSAVQAIIGALLIFYTDKLFEFAADAGIAVGALGAAGMLVSLLGVLIIAVAAFMLFTSINGLRGRIEKCRKCTFWLLIFQAGGLILAITKNQNATPSVLWLLFFGVYYLLAKMYMKYDNTY